MSYTTEEMREERRERLQKNEARYKFQPMKYLRSLSQKKIWMSNPKGFNDPFDLNFDIKDFTYRGPFSDEVRLRKSFSEIFLNNSEIENSWFYDDHFVEILKNWIEGHATQWEVIEAFKVRSSTFGVACFARDWDVPLMWSHYADSHRGMCVEYVVHPMKFAQSVENLNIAQYNVRYTTDVPTTCFSELIFTPHQVLANIIATKHADWSYEKEWRLVNFTNSAKSVSMPKHMQISALIVGLRFDMKKIELVIAKAKILKVPVYKMHPGHGQLLLQPL